jgi:putative methylase
VTGFLSGGRHTKKSQLERVLQSLDPVQSPKPSAEQYPTPAAIVAEVLHLAVGRGDIAGRSVVDLGCGNGVFAIGAKLAGAIRAVGVDSDPGFIEVARRNATRSEVEIEWVLSDVGGYRDSFDTVLMNPPFGAQTHRADRPFLDASMAVGHVIYTFLNLNSEDFVRRRFESSGARITDRLEYLFPIAHMFPFHRDEVRAQRVLLYRIDVAKG